MKIFTAEQIRAWDQFTISHEPVPSIQLMERASIAVAHWISENCKYHRKAVVFCGNGNNGGDGIAVARMLYQKGFDVDVFVNNLKEKFSHDALVNLKRLRDISGISIKKFSDIDDYNFDDKTMIVDALFGTGLSRSLEGEYKEVVNQLNAKKNIKISIDVPSGLPTDKIIENKDCVFNADYTLSFQSWKRTFLHPEAGEYTGKVFILDIDLSKEYAESVAAEYNVIDDHLIDSIFQPRKEFSHKGTYGKVMMIAGSYGKVGAAVLATKSALKTGAGLTFTLAPECGYEILQTSCPEAMFFAGGKEHIENFDVDENMTCGIGPGLGTHPQTEKSFLNFLKGYNTPLILDADALNMISKDSKNLKFIPEKSILTPHPKEFERLFGKTDNSFDRLELAREKAKELHVYIVLKDHHTQIINPKGEVYYNITGNAGLAKGGSGDILTGILTSLLAQGYSEEDTCILGVWLHGKAADFASEKYSKESMLPTDVINELGSVFKELNKRTEKDL
ncbi:bifunctional ADP-dependent NAD(P)H-hydrate dehydratase/NAD(P)H-hydrate epimerase [Chryseobacterium lactis]|uniref:Bifunctional NAD(P)H-hydrate repair enzyme n=1 Tax=Chryseobacterium lactis TaxID=1241981 RepID=A0A3G6RPJ0_CHRLC|nr:NAD(P)H-hydrate dehydratase [Chryseobacterium lactis]AZA82997.1 NAD(P)H-hydrate dehydratase [Chryseobacterium lactis]AZB03380.1 NAD(P)H-hydrate dehydratase [Chryseobacterium lactis]PNW12334.1 bifunctional ADP-dependent NAD(P)H-hydrate dehydratase/NAD(P)H-hydrate epimerase [Chryseobacterium lactis]